MTDPFADRARRRLRAAACPCAVVVLVALAGCSVSKRVGLPGNPPARPGAPVAAVPLRVALGEHLAATSFGCTGPFRLREGVGGRVLLELSAGRSVVARVHVRGLSFTTDGGATDTVPALVIEPLHRSDRVRWDGRSWRGSLRVVASAGAGLTVINLVELEDYLAGVVPLEIGRGRTARDGAAVAAQAVAARTYGFARLAERRGRAFDLHADTRDQVYGGADVEDPAASAAVAATAGLVLRSGGELVNAFFHANCGGHTAAKDAVWPVVADPVLRGVADTRPDGRPWCADGRGASWRRSWSWTELEAVLQRSLPAYLGHVAATSRSRWAADAFGPAAPGADGSRPGPLRALRVAETSPDGRAAVLEVVAEAGIYRVHGGRIRWVLRAADGSRSLLRSTLFALEVDEGRQVNARGRGHGHGLGLCQDGAVARSRAGQTYEAILAHYYPGARVAPIVAEDLP